MIARSIRRFFALVLASASLLPAADWPQFLGLRRDGRSSETIVSTFPDAGPKIVWKKAVGHGLAGPVVVGETVYFFHRDGEQAVIEAFSTVDGSSRWRHAYATDYRDDFGFDDGPRSPPTIAEGRLFAYGAEGRLTCLDTKRGELRWTKDLASDLDAPKGWFGRCCAPLVAG
jgi:outer membrane protein assembly factor BamB